MSLISSVAQRIHDRKADDRDHYQSRDNCLQLPTLPCRVERGVSLYSHKAPSDPRRQGRHFVPVKKMSEHSFSSIDCTIIRMMHNASKTLTWPKKRLML